ncbi:MAG: carboxymuconolactone decarboxylase family protein [Phycisphaerales bacterium]|nr:MAG: carboxymuconolactone decarboxylase family protein [Phycisphaerales bacterium]
MDERTKELIAIGASITANCQPCLEYHLNKALQHGADGQDMRDAIAVGQMVRKGATAKFDGFTKTAMAAAVPSEEQAEGCGCG